MTSDIRASPLTRAARSESPAVAGPLDAGHEVGEDHLLDTRLAERRQDPLDVPQEHPVRADDEHALVLEREAVGVEEVGGAVQGDDRLARARSTLHDQHPRLRRADDLVLLGLDRGDDVAERAGAAAFERGEQGRVAAQRRPALVTVLRHQPVVVADPEVAATEELVLETEHRAPLDDEVAAAQQPHRLAPGGPVERLGDGRPPVDDDRLGPLVGDRQAADVERLGGVRALGVAVDAPEDEGRIAEVEVGEALDQGLVERIALEPGLERATEIGLVEVAQTPG